MYLNIEFNQSCLSTQGMMDKCPDTPGAIFNLLPYLALTSILSLEKDI